MQILTNSGLQLSYIYCISCIYNWILICRISTNSVGGGEMFPEIHVFWTLNEWWCFLAYSLWSDEANGLKRGRNKWIKKSIIGILRSGISSINECFHFSFFPLDLRDDREGLRKWKKYINKSFLYFFYLKDIKNKNTFLYFSKLMKVELAAISSDYSHRWVVIFFLLLRLVKVLHLHVIFQVSASRPY